MLYYCANQLSSELSGGGSPSTSATLTLLLLEATGDSESDDMAGAAYGPSAFDADDGDAPCSGGDDGMELDVGRKLRSWECWMMETAIAATTRQEGVCLSSATEDAAPAAATESDDKLFWEACIAHGY